MFLCSFGYFPKGFSEPLKYWKGVRIYKLTIRPISNVTLGNKEENILPKTISLLFILSKDIYYPLTSRNNVDC